MIEHARKGRMWWGSGEVRSVKWRAPPSWSAVARACMDSSWPAGGGDGSDIAPWVRVERGSRFTGGFMICLICIATNMKMGIC